MANKDKAISNYVIKMFSKDSIQVSFADNIDPTSLNGLAKDGLSFE